MGREDEDGFRFYGGGYLATEGGQLAVGGVRRLVHNVWLGFVSWCRCVLWEQFGVLIGRGLGTEY